MADKKTSVLLQAAIDEVNSNKEIKKQMERLVKQFRGKYRLDCPVGLDTGPALRQAEQLVTQINRKMAQVSGPDLSGLVSQLAQAQTQAAASSDTLLRSSSGLLSQVLAQNSALLQALSQAGPLMQNLAPNTQGMDTAMQSYATWATTLTDKTKQLETAFQSLSDTFNDGKGMFQSNPFGKTGLSSFMEIADLLFLANNRAAILKKSLDYPAARLRMLKTA